MRREFTLEFPLRKLFSPRRNLEMIPLLSPCIIPSSNANEHRQNSRIIQRIFPN